MSFRNGSLGMIIRMIQKEQLDQSIGQFDKVIKYLNDDRADQIVTKTFTESEEFLDYLKGMPLDRLAVLFEPARCWLGSCRRGSIIIEEFKSLDELFSYLITWKDHNGKGYKDFIINVLANPRKTEQDIIDDFLYTEKNE